MTGLRSGEVARAAGGAPEPLRYYERRGLPAEVEARIADLATVRDSLRAALDAGCDDLVECAQRPERPVPFSPGGTRVRR